MFNLNQTTIAKKSRSNLDCNDWNSTGTNEVGGTSEFFLLGFPCELLVGGQSSVGRRRNPGMRVSVEGAKFFSPLHSGVIFSLFHFA